MKFRKSLGLDYKDVLLVPKFSDSDSRSNIDISSELYSGMKLDIPVIVANMDTVVNQDVIYAASQCGTTGIMHRYDEPEWVLKSIKELDHNRKYGWHYPIIPSVGAGDSQVELANRYLDCYLPNFSIDAICIDIAHGDSEIMCKTIEGIRKLDKYLPIIAGNVATPEAAVALMQRGANAIKVGIGPGFVCTTRKQTGAGYPQLSAIMEISAAVHAENGYVIADGGIREIGDIVKALAAGADTCMSGYLFAGSKESGKETYRGMASLEAQQNFKGTSKNIEGRSTNIETKGSIKDILQSIKEGIQSGLSYSGARNLKELRENAEFIILK